MDASTMQPAIEPRAPSPGRTGQARRTSSSGFAGQPSASPVDERVVRGDEAPDLAEEILGWKVLALGVGRRLRYDFDHFHQVVIPSGLWSPTRDMEWPASDWLRATCTRDPQHHPPVEDCTCGIYAVNDPSEASSYIREAPLTVLARVGLAGKVIPGSHGWRAERARVVALTGNGSGAEDYPALLAHTARYYNVPILDQDFLSG